MLTISELLWDEWSSYKYNDDYNGGVDAKNYRAECFGIISGMLNKDNDANNYLKAKTARRLIKIWPLAEIKNLLNKKINKNLNIVKMLEFESAKNNKKRRVRLAKSPEREELLVQVLSAKASWPWLRGLFGNCGSFYLTRSGCYLVLRIASEIIASKAEDFLNLKIFAVFDNKNKNNKKLSRRYFRGAHELIFREQDSVVTFLSNIGLNETALELENRVIMRLMRNQANKASNCDTANIIRATQAALKQAELAHKIFDGGFMLDLPEKLRELVTARLNYPEANLSELGEKLSPPISKSTVKYRWAKLNNYIKK